MTSSLRLPSTLAAARPLLEGRVFGVAPERIRRQEIGAGASRDFTIVSKGPGELRTGAVLAMGDERWPVTVSLIEFWRKEPHEVLAAALDETRERAKTTGFGVAAIAPGVYRSKAAGHPPLLLNHASLPSLLTVAGAPVLLIPTADTAFLTGSEDLEGLTLVAELARACLEERPGEAVSAMPVVRRDVWEPFTWPSVAAARLRDRRSTARLVTAVGQLDAAFDQACEVVRDRVRLDGQPVRRHFGSVTSDQTVLEGWRRLSIAFGLDEESAARVQEAAADTLTFYDANEAELNAAYSFTTLSRWEFRAEHYLALALNRLGSIVLVGRKSDPQLIAEDASASPAARAAGAVITLADEYDGTVEAAEDLSERMRELGVEVVALGDTGEDVQLVLFPMERIGDVREATRRIGDPLLVTYL